MHIILAAYSILVLFMLQKHIQRPRHGLKETDLWKVQNLYHVVGDASNATTINVVQNVTTDCVGEYIMTDYSMRLQDEENRLSFVFGRSSQHATGDHSIGLSLPW